MESQKIKNLLDHKDEIYSRYQTIEWCVINYRNNGNYPEGDGNDKGIKIDTEVLKPFLCDYADAYILVTGDIAVTRGNGNTKVAFKNSHPFIKCKIYLNDVHAEDSDNLDIIMNMYNLLNILIIILILLLLYINLKDKNKVIIIIFQIIMI